MLFKYYWCFFFRLFTCRFFDSEVQTCIKQGEYIGIRHIWGFRNFGFQLFLLGSDNVKTNQFDFTYILKLQPLYVICNLIIMVLIYFTLINLSLIHISEPTRLGMI